MNLGKSRIFMCILLQVLIGIIHVNCTGSTSFCKKVYIYVKIKLSESINVNCFCKSVYFEAIKLKHVFQYFVV